MKELKISDYIASSGVKFGTSGVRGLVDSMTDECCWLYVTAFIQHLSQKYGFKSGDKIVVAGDLRSSTPRIMNAVSKAIQDSGGIPVNCGFIPSPAVMHYGLINKCSSIMVTGSHIPEDRNGIKFNTAEGEILKPDEHSIVNQIVKIPEGVFNVKGMFVEPSPIGLPVAEAFDLYVKRYVDFFPDQCLAGKNIGLYEHSSVASKSLKAIFEALGANVTLLGYSEAFISVDTEAIRPEDTELAKQWSDQCDFDSIISTDGDGDRPLVSDEKGNWIRGDIAGVLTAQFLSAQNIATPINSNSVLEKSQSFERILRTRIGSPYVIEAMQELASDKSTTVGYEANGGFLLGTPISIQDRELLALPTRDAVIVALSILMLSIEQSKPISEVVASLPAQFTYSDRLKDFPLESSKKLIEKLHTGNMVEDKQRIAELFPELGEIKDINTIDGVRITFDGDDVIHIRPSGNAPELRCYTESPSQDKVVSLNHYGMALLSKHR